jgi:hypothetical protein
VEPDARNPESKFPGPPIVAPIDADDYSDNEHSYMNVSVNTAMSLVSVLSEETVQETTGIPTQVMPRRWADVASDLSQTTKNSSSQDMSNSDGFIKPSDLISALSSSRAEVDLLKEQVAELRAEREKTASTIAEAVKQQVAQVLADQLKPASDAESITGQQFQEYIRTQDRKFEALTAMFTQMMASQMSQTTTTGNRVDPQDGPIITADNQGFLSWKT